MLGLSATGKRERRALTVGAESERARLVAQHEGKFALIRGSRLVGIFDTHQAAYEPGLSKLGSSGLVRYPVNPSVGRDKELDPDAVRVLDVGPPVIRVLHL